MGKLIQFEIDLSQNVYYAGQWLQGQVIVNLSEPMKMRGIKLEFCGGANVHWTERHTSGTGKNRRTVTRRYSANETYFEKAVILYGGSGGVFSESTVHPAGIYNYPFQFQLPSYLPSSYEHTYGRVRYYSRCVIDRPWKFDHKTKCAFTVVCNLDLNKIPNVLSCPQGQHSKTLCCLCCASGPIEAVVRLSRKGYVPGEDILINAEITNGSNRVMDSSKAQLIQKTYFKARGKTRTQTSVIAETAKGPIAEGQSDMWNNEGLHIPPIPPTDLAGCNIIDIDYTIKFVVDPSGLALDLEIPLNVIIGTIPLQSYFTDYAAAAQAAYANNAAAYPNVAAGYPNTAAYPNTTPAYPGQQPAYPGQQPAYPGQQPAYPGQQPAYPGQQPAYPPQQPAYPPQQPSVYMDPSAPPVPMAPVAPMAPTAPGWGPPPGAPAGAPPPSYQASVFGKTEFKDEGDTEHTMGETMYAPIYPYYNWNQTPYSLPQQPQQKDDIQDD